MYLLARCCSIIEHKYLGKIDRVAVSMSALGDTGECNGEQNKKRAKQHGHSNNMILYTIGTASSRAPHHLVHRSSYTETLTFCSIGNLLPTIAAAKTPQTQRILSPLALSSF